MNGGPALVTSHNYARNVRACQEISEELGFTKLERLEEGQLRHVSLDQLEAQRVVHLAIKEALKEKVTSPEDTEPVSYTHLDVYKRQGCDFQNGTNGTSGTNGKWDGTGQVRVKKKKS